MDNFKKGGFRKGNGGFGGKPQFGGGQKFGPRRSGDDRHHGNNFGGPERELFKAKCAACFQACEVPFRPTSGKPVFCRDCFKDNAPSDRGDSRGGDRGASPRRDDRFSRDTGSARPEHTHAPHGGGNEDLKRDIAGLQKTVDYIVELLKKQNTISTPTVASVRTPVTEEFKEETPKKVRKPKTEKVEKAKTPAKKKVAKKKAK